MFSWLFHLKFNNSLDLEHPQKRKHGLRVWLFFIFVVTLNLFLASYKYCSIGPHKRGAWRIPTLERRQSQAGVMDNWGPNSLQVAHQLSEGPSISNTVRMFEYSF